MALDGGRADIEGLGNLANGRPLRAKFTKTIHVETSPWSSEMGTSWFGSGDAGLDPLDQQAALELGHRGDDGCLHGTGVH
jgi:hypothetical protein